MTAAHNRPSSTRRKRGWNERALLPGLAGVPWWAAVCLALGLTAAGVLADIQRLGRLGIVFQACYGLGCLLAVILVQRKALFGPMVQPPLILAVAVPGVVLLAGSLPAEAGAAATALAVGTPLINGFPTMAVATVVTLAVGGLRVFRERPPAPPRGRTTEADPETPGFEPPDLEMSDLDEMPGRISPDFETSNLETSDLGRLDLGSADDQGPPTEPIRRPIRRPPAPAAVPVTRRRRRS